MTNADASINGGGVSELFAAVIPPVSNIAALATIADLRGAL
jgi:hypothetical protein